MYINDLYLPAHVYLHSDPDAPVLTKQNLSLILKACLVSGYGSKAGAGWTMPYEDAAAGKRVFRPTIYGELDNYLRIADGNAQAVVQSYETMSDVDNGEKVVELAQPYMYGKSKFSGRWALVATERSFIMWTDGRYDSAAESGGTILFYGDSGQSDDGSKCCVLAHSGGAYNDGSFASPFVSNGIYPTDITDTRARNAASAYYPGQIAAEPLFVSLFGLGMAVSGEYTAPIYLRYADKLYSLPGVHTNTRPRNNLETVNDDGAAYLTMHAYGWANLKRYMARVLVRSDKWRY